MTLQLPSDAIAENLTAQVTSVSCPAKNFCAAVGYYTGTGSNNDQVHGFLATDAGGTWSRATIPPVPGGQSGASGLYSVSCPTTSYCVAVGSFGGAEIPGGMPFSVTYSNGKWQASSRPALPANLTADEIESMGVSCHSARDCVAVGTAYNFSFGNDTGLQWIESRGRWGRLTTTLVPSAADRGTGADLASVSCSAATSCISVGFYVRHASNAPLQVVVSNGRWQRGLGVPHSSALGAVSCTTWHCVAVGQYDANYGSLVVSERHGAELGSPVHIHLPSNAIPNHDNEQLNGLTAVSCLGRSWCAAVGYYSGPAPGGYLAMVSTS